jgi:hypothetical protein
MKRRLKSSKASRGVWPKPLAPRCRLGPIYASQTLPTTLNLGRNCAAGLRGCISRKSSTSSLMISGSSSIWREITFRKRNANAVWISKLAELRNAWTKRCEDAYALPELPRNGIAGPPNQCRTECFRSWMRPRIALKTHDKTISQYAINRGPRAWRPKSLGSHPC